MKYKLKSQEVHLHYGRNHKGLHVAGCVLIRMILNDGRIK